MYDHTLMLTLGAGDLSLITTIAAGFTGAWALGLLAQRFKLSPIVGYLLAGVAIGPHTPGFVGNIEIATQLAEIGVILLMFGVGLHFHLKDLLAVKWVAIPGAVVQSVMATGAAIGLFALFGETVTFGAVTGMAMAVASTVVLMRVLMDADVLNSTQGHVAVGWLIVEDIFTVVLLVLIPVLGQNMGTVPPPEVVKDVVEGATAVAATAGGSAGDVVEAAKPAASLWGALGIAMLKLGALVVIVMILGAKTIPWVLVRVARLRSRELFTLTVLVFSIAIAAASYFFFGASMALGAFLAGMVVAQSPVSHQAAADALPMRDAFAVLFFVSVGMLFDPAFILKEPLMILTALGIILIVKPLAALLIVAVLGHSVRTALTVALGLAQIGEFSFILSELAKKNGLMQEAGHNVLVAAAIVSITLNPFMFRSLPAVEAWLRGQPRLWKLLNGRAERKARATNAAAAEGIEHSAHEPERVAVVVGFGPVGRSVHRLLRDAGLKTVVVDMNMDTVSALNGQGQAAIFGDASHEAILEQAGAKRASHVVLTLPNAEDRAAVVAAARNLNPTARILVRARFLGEREELERAGANGAVFEEAEAAVALARLVLADTGVHRDAAERKVRDLRLHLIQENMSNIRSQRIRGVMVPWTRVKRLSKAVTRDEVLRQVSEERYSRWPVVDGPTGRAVGYLLVKDLISIGTKEQEDGKKWTDLVRPLQAIRPDADVESTLAQMQRDGATIYVVEDGASPVGLVTLEDILEQVVGRIEDEYPHEKRGTLADAIEAAGAMQLQLTAGTREQVITSLASLVPADRVPRGAEIGRLAIEREKEMSTDLGNGVAIPHARCPGLKTPMVVFGRSENGVAFSPDSGRLVHLVFLLVTPLEQPEVQLTLLGQLAALAGDEAKREQLRRATTSAEVMAVVEGK